MTDPNEIDEPTENADTDVVPASMGSDPADESVPARAPKKSRRRARSHDSAIAAVHADAQADDTGDAPADAPRDAPADDDAPDLDADAPDYDAASDADADADNEGRASDDGGDAPDLHTVAAANDSDAPAPDGAATPMRADGAAADDSAAIAGDSDDPDAEPGDTTEPFVVEEWVYAAVESMAFTAPESLTPRRAKEILVAELRAVANETGAPAPALPTIHDIKRVFKTLVERWKDPARTVGQGFKLMELDGGLAFRTAASGARYVRRLQTEKPPRLGRAALETLAVIAYRQPATKPQVEEVRGVDSGGALKTLLDKKLIRIIGKADEIGRPLLYGTTKTFLEFFQLDSLGELPTLKELHELENGPTEPLPEDKDAQPAVVMDLFNPDRPGLISEETEKESAEALDDLEEALSTAKSVAKKASTVVWGVEVEEDPPAKDESKG